MAFPYNFVFKVPVSGYIEGHPISIWTEFIYFAYKRDFEVKDSFYIFQDTGSSFLELCPVN